MTSEAQLREKLRKIAALFERATTEGERQAAAAAMGRLTQGLGSSFDSFTAPPKKPSELIEFQFSFPDRWQRRLFVALCRRHSLKPYRYKRQRYTTVMVRVDTNFLNRTLWPEFLELRDALNEYLNEATERIIREEVFGDAEEASEQAG